MTTAKKRPTPPTKASNKASGSSSVTAAKSSAGTARGVSAPTKRGPLPAPKKPFPVLPVVFVGVALALIAAIVFSSDRSINAETGVPEVTGEALSPYQTNMQPANDPSVGAPVPAVEGEDFDGNTVSIDPTDGSPKAILFLAHWCPHCQAEVPRVQAWLDAGGGVEGVEIVSVLTSMNSSQPNYPPSEWMEREGWTSPMIRDGDGNEVLAAYGAGGFPYYVFADGDGNVVRRSSGELDIATLEAYMQEIAP
ncbi:hypothetical protein BH24ACT7_BH24ACT7_01910 [soil metagenome]